MTKGKKKIKKDSKEDPGDIVSDLGNYSSGNPYGRTACSRWNRKGGYGILSATDEDSLSGQ